MIKINNQKVNDLSKADQPVDRGDCKTNNSDSSMGSEIQSRKIDNNVDSNKDDNNSNDSDDPDHAKRVSFADPLVSSTPLKNTPRDNAVATPEPQGVEPETMIPTGSGLPKTRPKSPVPSMESMVVGIKPEANNLENSVADNNTTTRDTRETVPPEPSPRPAIVPQPTPMPLNQPLMPTRRLEQ